MGRERSAQKGSGKEVLKKGEEKGVLKTGEEKKAEKGLQNSRILKRMAGWRKFANFEGLGSSVYKLPDWPPMRS